MVHPAAATGFARSVEAYERARPEYPPEAIAWLARELDLRAGRTVVDLAAGSGKLTRPLAALGCEVIAVEPVAEMRAAIGPAARALDGTAEAIPLPDEAPMPSPSARPSIGSTGRRRWPRSSACCAPAARSRSCGTGARASPRRCTRRSARSWLRYRGDAPPHGSGAWRDAFAGRELVERLFEFSQRLDADGLADRVGSTSFVAALDDEQRQPLLARVRALAADGPVDVPYVCELHLWRRG